MSGALKRRVTQLQNEPTCPTSLAKSDADKRKGCAVRGLTPGAAAGGCAFDGAMITLQPVVDALHLIHGPIACLGNSWDNRHSGTTGPTLYRRGFTTDMSELDVIHGGEKRLWKALKQAIARHQPPAVFVYQTCVPGLIGDDIVAVCKEATERLGTPCIPVEAPGFIGSKNLGNKLAGQVLLDHVIGTREPDPELDPAGPTDVNLIAEYNVAGELAHVTPLFDALGIKLRTALTGDARFHRLQTAHHAKVNMVLCSHALFHVARHMEQRWGIPWFEGSFYGMAAIGHSLRHFARLLAEQGADPTLPARAEALIAEREAATKAALAPYMARIRGKKALLYTGGHKSWSVVSALQELGLEVIRTSVRKATETDKGRALELLDDDEDRLAGAIPNPELYRILKEGEADIMLSGGRSQFVALKAAAPWLDINQERHHTYAGYDGLITLARELDKALNSPVFPAARAAAPWDDDGNLLPEMGEPA
ncbi:nitrogenase iron-molybdenum cofactor biosynthesis protein NifE [Roseospirillum parvum]|uniref:Nitrogenase iron-molybdenum cofactor biosynthesis protein NifE n=1 Tax=Roseospirillum parvum TaxID=83401 RepID=A0A1G8G9X5_9PROT|nr:nitrogenase iron-molybdenum cofactor biosynthesis protein NifE [Roseospirillum parvum]SDH91185.1 nitrogenase molybdenum-cofactor synthesis protein NifE [Roseospirillum parvum]